MNAFHQQMNLKKIVHFAGISIPVTKYKREALNTCNPGVDSVEEALQRCFTDRNINITKILDNPMLFVEIILGQMDVTCR